MNRSKIFITDYYVISADFRLLEFNQNVKDRYKGIQRKDLCYQATMKRDTPCPHCPIAGNSQDDCPVYYDPFYRDWVQAIFSEIGDGKYAVTCHPANGDARSMFQRLKIDELPLQGKLLTEYDSENIGMIGGYCEEGFPLYYVNDRMVEMLGYDSIEDFEEGIDRKVVNTIHPDDLPQVIADLGDHYYLGKKYETTYRMPRKDGTWFWTVDRGEVIETSDGRLAIISACLDVTKEHERQEARKRESDASASKDRILSDIIRALYSYNATVNLKTGKYSLLVGTGMEEFSREHNTTDNKNEGTGLGMPIVKRLVEFLGGTIEVKSEKGVGTTVIVTLPHRIAEKSDLVMHARVELDPKLFQGKCILLAEDNELNAEIAIEILKEAGFVIELAEDGQICVDMLTKAPLGYYDLILMDIQMPNMNGYDATRTIRELPDSGKAKIPILAMTANAFEEDKREAYRCGMNGHLAKPINVRELMKELANILG